MQKIKSMIRSKVSLRFSKASSLLYPFCRMRQNNKIVKSFKMENVRVEMPQSDGW
jgi:hypothetical protein